MIQKLDKSFEGKGEMKGFTFTLFKENDIGYIYEVTSEEGNIYYEVFKKKTTPICLDFDKRLYSDTDTKEMYPKTKDFGIWAWDYIGCNKAEEKLNEITNTDNNGKE